MLLGIGLGIIAFPLRYFDFTLLILMLKNDL